jgi:hypothetical protein
VRFDVFGELWIFDAMLTAMARRSGLWWAFDMVVICWPDLSIAESAQSELPGTN